MPLTFIEKLALITTGAAAAYGFMRVTKNQTAQITKLQETIEKYEFEAQLRDTNQTRQTQALVWLHNELSFDMPLPPMRGWSISPDIAALLVELLRKYKPKTILELGGGSSTIIAAKVMREIHPDGKVIAVEAIEKFANHAEDRFRRYGVDDITTVIHAPLVKVEIENQNWMWYDPEKLKHIENIDFMLVDGPSQHLNPKRMVRYPALPVMRPQLSENALILMDDAHREDETMIAERWQKEYSELQLIRNYDNFEKGALFFKLRQNQS